ncbi:LysR family transcriptional regulator [Dickeya dianthicola]|uniref:LysR family transcriptional regulator n=1 Tax=Dickeya dianthicola TaxID=204039 RepID=UPI001867FAFA|nr:LysR family transcriptional regulator [Dickeya dianthicola]MCI4185749.1 LysR family transcriptional regulator [Dickeya dianthicola]QOL16070.1 LysR family transcriptional regulator [Dickeya dianthicola]
MTQNVKLHQLQSFVEVARHGSIRAASRQLNLSQPALTKSIQELEACLGARLFLRHRQGMALTDCGEAYFRHASLIMEELRVAREDIQQRLGQASGRVNIGVGASIAHTVMPEVVSRFHRLYPQVKLRVTEGQLVAMIHELRQGELDFTVNTYSGSSYDNELLYEKLMEKEYCVVVRRDHPIQRAHSLDDLLDYEWTLPTPRGSYYKQLFDLFATLPVAPRVSVTCETLMSNVSLVAKTDFISILSRDVIRDPILGERLRVLELDQPLPNATFYLIQRKDTMLSPMGAQLAKLFRRYCR